MLRVEFHDSGDTLTMQLEGRLVAEFADVIKEFVLRGDVHRDLVIDLSEVLFVDAAGEDVLSWLNRIGSKFLANTSYSLHICERLQLPLASKRSARSRGQDSSVVPK